MAVSGAKPQARLIEVGTADFYIDQVGSGCPYIETYLLGGGALVPAIHVRDMVTESAYEEGVGRITPQASPQDDGTAAVDGAGQIIFLPPYGGCYGGGGVEGVGYISIPSPEHSSTIYCN